MNKYLPYILIIFVAISVLLPGCDKDEFSTSPHHILSFSPDTVYLDTVFTGLGTSTYGAKVYNRNKESLLISSITLAGASQSGFRINVDGRKGTQFTDVEIYGRDSLYIFIEATLPPDNKDAPFLVKDSIVFITNGVKQDIKLLAYGQDAIFLRGKVIDKDTIFTASRPIVIYDSLRVDNDATLTLSAGTRLFFHPKSGLKVYGRLKSEGSISSPVLMRGDRTDKMFSYLPYSRLPGQWEGVRFYTSSYENELTYTEICGGMYGIECDSSKVDRRKLSISNSVIHQVSGDALKMTSCQAVVGNTQISNAGGNCIRLLGGDYNFVHCTVANYFNWNVRRGTALYLSNTQGDIEYPLSMASFRNCIIAGSSLGEISLDQSKDETVPCNYYFSHCIINAEAEEGDNIVGVTWLKDDYFRNLDREYQIYDFRLTDKSQSINAGLLQDALYYPVDRDGISRVSDEAPDAGCYEYDGQ